MSTYELTRQVLDAVQAVRDSSVELDAQARNYAMAERNYKHAKSVAFLSTTGTVAEREARAEEGVNESRYKRDLAEGLKVSALEAVRSNRSILSALQSLIALERAEAQLAKFGPDVGEMR